jgi:adenine-specific DNA-methyltransferase
MSQDEFDDINQTPRGTPDFKTDLAAQLSELVPEAIADGKVDVEKLKELLGDDAGDDASDDRERFGLFWPGKKRALRAAQEPTTATLKPDVENSKDWDTTKNVFIEGDNLEVLKILDKHYHGKIKMIYIDPPYNTGKDFIYPDNYKEGLASYLEWTRQVNEEGKKVSTNSETEGRYHSNWLNMMYPRLKLAKNLLSEDGVIFVSIGDQELDNLKKVCNEVFGEDNFLANVVWANREGGGGSDSTTFKSKHEYLLAYARSRLNAVLFGDETEEDNSYAFEDEFVAERGRYKLIKLNSFSIQYSKSMDYEIENDDGSVSIPSENGRRGIWRWSRAKYDWGLANDFIVKKQQGDGYWTIYTKQYFKVDNNGDPIVRTLPPNALVEKYSSTGATKALTALLGGTKIFDYPKPVPYLKHILKWVTKGDDIVLDFFAGSGTTAHAVLELNNEDGGNRRFIQVQLPEPVAEGSEAAKAGFRTIADISRRRIILAGETIGSQIAGRGVDVGYKAYALTDSNFTKWRIDSATDASALEQHLLDLRDSADDNASPHSLLTELLLKQGYSLTEQIGDVEVDGLTFKSVGDGLLLAYLDENTKPTLQQLRTVLDSPDLAKFIILEDAFKGDDELKTNLVQEAKSRNIELWTA